MKQLAMSVGCILLVTLASCGAPKTVERIEADTTIDLSGEWNDTDSRQVSEAMITDCLNHPWITQHTTTSGGKKPVVIVGGIRNRSSEHIAIPTFVSDIERAFINSGLVSVVASANERGSLRDEKDDQSMFATPESAKQMGQERGADYMLMGQLNTIKDREGGKQVTFYQVDLTLTNIENNQKVWLGQKKIKKFIQRKRAAF